ncbi:MAG: transposase, partial [Sedimentibacter sp.]
METKIDRMAGYLKKQRGKAVRISEEFNHYFDLIYYHEGQGNEVFMMGKERTDIISCEIRLCGYFCIITSEKMTAKEPLELYKSRDG